MFTSAVNQLFVRRQQRGIQFQKTRTAINGPALGRIERHGRIAAALGAGDRYFDPLFDAEFLGGVDGGDTFILRLFARLAAFRRVFQILIVKELLFARGPDEITAAIDAVDRLVGKLGFA